MPRGRPKKKPNVDTKAEVAEKVSRTCQLLIEPFDDRKVYAAIGDSGNIIYVSKEENVSVGITGTFKPRIFDRVDFIEKRILPVI